MEEFQKGNASYKVKKKKNLVHIISTASTVTKLPRLYSFLNIFLVIPNEYIYYD